MPRIITEEPVRHDNLVQDCFRFIETTGKRAYGRPEGVSCDYLSYEVDWPETLDKNPDYRSKFMDVTTLENLKAYHEIKMFLGRESLKEFLAERGLKTINDEVPSYYSKCKNKSADKGGIDSVEVSGYDW